MREKDIEKRLKDMVKDRGGMALKFVSPGQSGMPDRLILMPGSKMAFIEVKAPGREPRKLQVKMHKLLRGLGFRVYVLDDPKQIGGIIDDIQST